jgi:hypothetical protein
MLKKKHILYAADVCLLHTGKEEKTDYRFSLGSEDGQDYFFRATLRMSNTTAMTMIAPLMIFCR